jgi:hypothetical protein
MATRDYTVVAVEITPRAWALTQRSTPVEGSWLERILARKPKVMAAIALVNKVAQTGTPHT